jgi:hypothetical protein
MEVAAKGKDEKEEQSRPSLYLYSGHDRYSLLFDCPAKAAPSPVLSLINLGWDVRSHYICVGSLVALFYETLNPFL